MEILAGSLAVAGFALLAFVTLAVRRRRVDELSTRGDSDDGVGLTRRSFVRLSAACGVALGVLGVQRRALSEGVSPADPGVSGGGETIGAVARAEPWGPSPRVILPMSSGTNVPRGESMLISARPTYSAFRPERFVVACPEDWWIEDIQVGGVSQFDDVVRRSGGVPALSFGASSGGALLSTALVQTAMDLSIAVRYTGVLEHGAPFYGAVVGATV